MKVISTATISLIALLPFTMVLWAPIANAYNVAVFPVLDLTKDSNGVNMEFTSTLLSGINGAGIELIPEKSIISFMARHRIRVLGRLTTDEIRKVKEELGSDLILIGVLCDFSQTAGGSSVGLVLHLMRTADAKIVWSMVRDLSQQDFTHILGISEASGVGDLTEKLIGEIVHNWPKEIDVTGEPSHVMQFEVARIYPRYVKPGKLVTCVVKPRIEKTKVQRPKLILRVKDMVIEMEEDREFPGTFRASWKASMIDGRYSVVLVTVWPTGLREKNLIGSYYVDSVPPAVELAFKNVVLEDLPTTNNRLVIMPRLKAPEPTEYWRLIIKASDNSTVLNYDGAGQLPKRLYWHARNIDGSSVPDGIYTVILKVWDRAGNQAVVSKKVRVRRNPPKVDVSLKRRQQDVIMVLTKEKGLPIAFWWVRVSLEDGAIIVENDGESLPAEIRVASLDQLNGKNVLATVTVTDIVGNEYRRRIINLLDLLPAQKKKTEKDKYIKEWIEDF